MSRESSFFSYLRNLKRVDLIDKATYSKILPCRSTAGVLFGLPKVFLKSQNWLPLSPNCLLL